MLNIAEIEKFYPENQKLFRRNLLREYLQYKILQLIFESDYSNKLSFLGGTALRIIYDNARFSEDLDFDNFGLEMNEFEKISFYVKEGLEKEGYDVEIRNVQKGAFRCYLRIPKILFSNNLSGYVEEKILVQIDSQTHKFYYKPEIKLLSKFDVFTEIFVTDLPLILSQKIVAAFGRKRAKGRDFYDIQVFLGQTLPDYNYLKEKLDIANGLVLKKRLLELLASLDFKELAKDVDPFLYIKGDSKRVELFPKFIEQFNFL